MASNAFNGPDFIIIGAMKCGTSTLQAQLAAQAGVFMTTPKEPNYFSDDDVYGLGSDWYASLFADAQSNDVTGEASTHYTKLPTYPETIARMQSEIAAPKMIYLIRNPVQRAISHFVHEWTENRMGDDIEQAFRDNITLVDYGRYAMQIKPFIDAYGADAVHLTCLEGLKADPDGEFAKITDFLGLKDAKWTHDLEAQNVSSERSRPLPFHGLLVDNPIATTLRRILVPKFVRTMIRESRSMKQRPELTEQLTQDLEQIYTNDRASLADLFPGNPALKLSYPFVTDD